MLLTIHNLPVNTRYSDVKTLIQSQCGLSEVLLDHLVKDGQYKKVTVGVVEEEDAAILVRKINGLYVQGAQLYVEDIRQKKKSSEQPYRPMASLTTNRDIQQDKSNDLPGPQSMYAQQNSAFPMNMPYSNMANYNQYMMPEIMPLMMNQQMMGMGMYVMPQQQNAFMDNSGQVPATAKTSTANYNFNNLDQNAPGMMANNSAGSKNKRGRNVNPQNRDGGDVQRDRNNHPYQVKQSGWGSEPNKPNDKRSVRSTRWNAGEAGPSGRRSRSPHRVDSCEDAAYDSRYRDSPQRYENSYHGRNAPNDRDPRDSNYDPRDDETFQSYKAYEGPMKDDDRRYNQRDEPSQRWGPSNFQNNDRAQTGRDSYKSDDRRQSDRNQPSRKRPNPDSFGNDNALARTWGESLTQSSHLNRNESQFAPPQKIQRLPELMKQKLDVGLIRSTSGNPSGRENPPVWGNSSGKGYSPPRLNPPRRGNSPARGKSSDVGYPSVRENTFDRGNPAIRGNPSGRGNSAVRGNLSGRGNPAIRANPSGSGNPADKGSPSSRGNPAVRGDSSGRGNPAIRGNPSSRGNPAIRGEPSGRGNAVVRGGLAARGNLAVRGNPSGKGNPKAKGNPPAPHNKSSDYKAMIRRDTAWRQLAVALIGKQIFAEHDVPMSPSEERGLLKAIKKAVHTRVDLLLLGEFAVPAPTIVEKYRKRFPVTGDKVFLAAVIKNLAAEENKIKQEEQVTDKNQAVPAQQVKATVPMKQEGTNAMPVPKTENVKLEESAKLSQAEPAIQVKVPVLPPEKEAPFKLPPIPKTKKSAQPAPVAASGKLPNYPGGNKAVHQLLRKQRKKETINEDLYELDPYLAAAVEKELDGLCNVIVGELSNPASKEDEPILKRLKVEPMIILRKSVKMTLVKRLLDIRTSLALTVFVEGKIPTPASMSNFLRRFGVISLKKSKNKQKSRPFFVATCADYEAYDNLCSLKSTLMSEITELKFRPLHVTPKKPIITTDDIQNHLSRQSMVAKKTQGSSTEVIDCTEDETLFYEDVEGVWNEYDDVKDNDIKTDDTDEKNDSVKKDDTGNDGVTNDDVKNEDTGDDVKNENIEDDSVNNSVTNEKGEKNNDTHDKGEENSGTKENNDNGVKNTDTNDQTEGNVTNNDENEAIEEDATYDVDDGEDYFMMDGEEYRVEDEITEIKETDLEDY
ncbi:hypothetical protein evm_010405 [Chilo suppressalis]|nr:hypothetical protein evm_010405 [Chilo suppressalis]